MASVMRSTWPLLLGMLLLMVGNGMQGTLLGIRGGIEGIPTFEMSVVIAAYYVGFLLGSLMVPDMIKNVGHVRVFAALGSTISAVLVLYALAPQWMVWSVLRFAIGFCFCGVYITAESWLNAGSTNENRGRALAAYMIMQMLGIVVAQGLLNFGDPSGFLLFALPSVLVSLAFMPILLSTQPAPKFETIQRMSFARLYRASPLGCVGIFLMGGVFSALSGMASVWGSAKGLSVAEIASFVAAIYVGGLALQYPVGWISDRYDRRKMVLIMSAGGALVTALTVMLQPSFAGLMVIGAIMGGLANPIYALLLAYTNDYLDQADMAAASAGLLFIYGIGSMGGPVITGWLMGLVGPDGYWIYMGVLLGLLALYGAWRMTRRRALRPAEQGNFAVIAPNATGLAVEAALDEAQSSGEDGAAPDPQDKGAGGSTAMAGDPQD
ncbi:MAG: MFS transporter [Paracoccus sp. (in: a-proteobacteria)]